MPANRRSVILAAALSLMTPGAGLAAKPNPERPNPALELLRTGVWMERGERDFFEPAAGQIAEPAAVLVNAAWETTQLTPTLTPPTLVPGGGWGTPKPAPEVVHARPIDAARPIAAVPIAVPIGGLTPCQDLTRKALKLRNAATRCDTDVANGHPSCSVAPDFDSPPIPSRLSAQDARSYAGRFERVVNGGDERACAAFGGRGAFPDAPSRPLMERLKDAVNTMANEQVNRALLEYAAGGLLSKITYGPEALWTRALRNHFYLDTVRERIADEYRKDPSMRRPFGGVPYTLNQRSISENLRLLLRDLIAPIIGANMAYATGSINFHWEQVGEVDAYRRQVTVKITAKDALRLGSQTRVPFTELEIVSDDAFGAAGPMHTVQLEWEWTEVISY